MRALLSCNRAAPRTQMQQYRQMQCAAASFTGTSLAAAVSAVSVVVGRRGLHAVAAASPCRMRGSAVLLPRSTALSARVGLLPQQGSRSSLSHSSASMPLHREWRRYRSCGIIGLPNVGKSTLFNALTDTQLAEASNYPFCTIEPNTAKVAVPDPLLAQLAALAKTDRIIDAQMTFVDIAGIIKGASAGAGLGNKFLQNIKDVDVVLHVVRCFDDPQVIHVDSTIDPLADMETIETELLLADLQTVEKRIENAEKKNKTKDAAGATMTAAERSAFLLKLRGALNAGYALSDVSWDNETEVRELASMHLLTAKPMAYVCNVDESSVQKGNKYTEKVQQHVDALNAEPERTLPPEAGGVRIKRVPRACLRVCSQLESEVQTFDSAEARAEFLAMNSLEGTSLVPVIHTANRLLQNEKYYTVGVQEARAWSIERGTNAQDAAGKIHSDLRDKFVCAEVIKPADFIKHGGDAGARQAGVMRVEGKSYIVQDADIILFRVQGQKR